MKTEIASILIICGTVLIAVPPISDYFYHEHVTRILIEKPEVTQVTLGQPMGDEYRIACWVAGAGMIAVAVISALVAGKRRAAAPSDSAGAGRFPETGM